MHIQVPNRVARSYTQRLCAEPAVDAWHGEFERRAPEAHQSFLLSLGIPPEEASRIRARAR